LRAATIRNHSCLASSEPIGPTANKAPRRGVVLLVRAIASTQNTRGGHTPNVARRILVSYRARTPFTALTCGCCVLGLPTPGDQDTEPPQLTALARVAERGLASHAADQHALSHSSAPVSAGARARARARPHHRSSG
jgi:hypothetical protein